MNEKLSTSDGLKVWIQDFLDSSAPQFKGKSPKERIKMAIAAFIDAGGKLRSEDHSALLRKINNEGKMKNEKMDQSKLTGREISVYFRKNPKAKAVKKAVEIALDHGGAMNYAIKQIEKLKRGMSKHPEVKKALDYANFESVQKESIQTVNRIITENYTRNFELLCNSIKLNKVQQKILDQFIKHGTIKSQYVGRVAGVKKEKKFFAAKKQYKGSIENRTEALMSALKVNAHQKKILDSYLKTGKVIGKYAGSIAGETKTTKSYSAFRGFKEHFDIEEEITEYTRTGKSMSRKDLLRKYGNEMKKALRTGSLELSDKAEEDLTRYVMDNHPEEIRTDDPDEWVQWLDDNLEDFVKGRGYK